MPFNNTVLHSGVLSRKVLRPRPLGFSPVQPPYFFNFRPGAGGNVAVFNAKKRLMPTGVRPKVLYIGDSKTMAYNISGTNYTGASPLSITKKTADLLVARGLQANKDLAFFSQGPTNVAGYISYDSRFAATSWTLGSRTTLGGAPMISVNPNTDSLAFTVEGMADRVTVYYIRVSTGGTLEVLDGASSLGTQSTAGTPAVLTSVTYNLSSRATGKTINIRRTTANTNQIDIAGVIAWDSQTPALDIVNAGRFGTQASSEWIAAANPWSALNAIQAFAPDLTVINLGSNDMNSTNNVSASTFRTNLQTIINAAKISGSVVLVNPTKGQSPGFGTATVQNQYSAAIRQLAISNDIPMIDEGRMFENFTVANGKGWFSDTIHESVTGTDVRAYMHAEFLYKA